MTDMIDQIADCLVEDHIKLMHENKALRDQIEIMNKEFDKYLDAVIKAEREACAKVSEDYFSEGYCPMAVAEIAAEIRARGQHD